MKSKFAVILSAVLCLFIFFGAISVSAQYGEIAENIIAYKLEESGAADVQEWIDGVITENAGVSSEWYVLALSQRSDYDFSSYRTALERYVQNNDIRSATTAQKLALTLIATGSNSEYIGAAVSGSIGNQGIMSWVYGLHLLNNGCESGYTATEITEHILSSQLDDGGWAVTGAYGDVDVTAMTLHALAHVRDNDERVQTAIDKALTFLSEKQNPDGDYSSYGVANPESTAQVLIALSELGIDAAADQRFIKNGRTLFDGMEKYRLPDGSYCHEDGGKPNEISMVQVFCGITAYEMMIQDRGSFFIFDNTDEEHPTVTVTETSVAADTEEAVTPPVITKKRTSYKPLACLAVLSAAVIVCIVMYVLKKRGMKNYIPVFVWAAVFIAVILLTEIKLPGDYYGTSAEKENPIGTVTVSIRCDTVAGENREHIPSDGTILPETSLDIEEGETVYDVLVEACRMHGIHLENNGGAAVYISGINNLYEFDFGDLSGWIYHVNGESPSVGCDAYVLSDGDEIQWLYSREIGNDLK